MARKLLMVGNWKMNQNLAEIKEFISTVKASNDKLCLHAWIAPQLIHVGTCLTEARGSSLKVGAQNCSDKNSGALTGETSPTALKEMGANFTLIGHSERRAFFGESDELLATKVKTALAAGLEVILCVGETLAEREADQTLAIVSGQVKAALTGIPEVSRPQIIIAYEPVWAIGTGKVAGPEQAQEVHAAIRQLLPELGFKADSVSILYGGSVKPDNVDALLACPDIDGGLVGGASLKASDYLALCQAVKRLE